MVCPWRIRAAVCTTQVQRPGTPAWPARGWRLCSPACGRCCTRSRWPARPSRCSCRRRLCCTGRPPPATRWPCSWACAARGRGSCWGTASPAHQPAAAAAVALAAAAAAAAVAWTPALRRRSRPWTMRTCWWSWAPSTQRCSGTVRRTTACSAHCSWIPTTHGAGGGEGCAERCMLIR